MIVAALTGGIASGKSEVLGEAESISGVRTLEADELAKEIYDPDNPCFPEVLDLLGEEVVTDDGSVDLELVSYMVFNDEELLEELEEISHPYVKGRIEGILECYEKDNVRMVLVEIPLLFQSSTVELDIFDLVILVLATGEDQLNRLVNRDGVSVEEAKERIALQKLPDEARERSDYVIDATKTVVRTREQARDLLTSLLE